MKMNAKEYDMHLLQQLIVSVCSFISFFFFEIILHFIKTNFENRKYNIFHVK